MNTLQSALLEGVQVTVVGMAIVFGVLIILMLVLMAMKKVFYKEPAQQQVKEEIVVKEEPVTTSVSQPDETELIAVLAAAVAASSGLSTYNLKIKSYRRIGSSSPSWHRAGINETINSRY